MRCRIHSSRRSKVDLQDQFKKESAESTTTEAGLAAITEQITRVKNAQRAGNVSLKESEEELAVLGEKKLKYEEAITQQKLKQKSDINSLETQGIQQEIDLLELRREEGINVDNALVAKREELHQARIKALELEYQAERSAAKDKLAVEEKYQLARRNLEREFTLEAAKEVKKRFDDAKRASDSAKEPSKKAQLKLGQSSDNPNFFSVDASGFSFQSDEDKQAKKARQEEQAAARRRLFEELNPGAVAKVRDIDAKRALEQAQADAKRHLQGFQALGEDARKQYLLPTLQESLRKVDPSGVIRSVQEKLNPSSSSSVNNNTKNQTTNVTNSVTVNIESRKTRTVSTPEDAVREVRKAITLAQIYDPKAGLV